MKKKMIQTLVAIPFALAAFAFTTQANAQETVDMHRLYNPNSGEHFYTANTAEKDHLVKVGWKYEGLGWLAPKAENDYPVYRVYNPNAGDHHYTMDIDEMSDLVYKHGWKFEGIGWYSDQQKGKALYRAYNPNAKAGAHNYTTSLGEQKNLIKVGWKDEGMAWYGVDLNKKDEPSTTTPPKDNGSNQNQGGQTTPPKNNSGDGGSVTPPVDNGGKDSGQVTPPVDQTPGYVRLIPNTFSFDEKAIRDELLRLVNDERQNSGVKSLSINDEFQKIADIRAEEVSREYSHTRPNGKSNYSLIDDDPQLRRKYFASAENIAVTNKGDTNQYIAFNLFTSWKNSKGHYANMLGKNETIVGVGVYLGEKNGYKAVYSVMYFGSYLN